MKAYSNFPMQSQKNSVILQQAHEPSDVSYKHDW